MGELVNGVTVLIKGGKIVIRCSHCGRTENIQYDVFTIKDYTWHTERLCVKE